MKKGSKTVTVVFYLVYFLMILGYLAGMYFLRGWLIDQLVIFEASTQPAVRAEEVFRERFAEPDWGQLYEDSNLTDTVFEGKETFLAYIAANVDDSTLTYQETDDPSDGCKYRILEQDQPLGHFTLVNRAAPNARIPDWQLGEIEFLLPRTVGVTVEKQDGHTVLINGQPLDDSYTSEILSTAAEQYLPAGTSGIRRIRQEVSGLLMLPEITIQDSNGNLCEVHCNEESGIYTEVPPAAETISKELKDVAIAAGEAYCTYMVEQDNYQLFQHFASGTQTYRDITSARPWPQNTMETEITDQRVSDYVRYTENLFSARVAMQMHLIFGEKNIRTRTLDSILFFEHKKDGWRVIAMTDGDITAPTSKVRLTFMSGDTLLSSVFYDSNMTEIYAPTITAPEGQMLSGWGEKITSTDGSTELKRIFPVDDCYRLIIPQDTVLTPMTLYPVFEESQALG